MSRPYGRVQAHGSASPGKPARAGLCILLLLVFLAGCSARMELARLPLPHVTTELENPSFWISKLDYPDSVLLTTEEIRQLNESIISQGLIVDVVDMGDVVSGDSIRGLMISDLESHAKLVRFGHNNHPLSASFYEQIRRSMDVESIPSTIHVRFGLITQRTDIRALPTSEMAMGKRNDYEFDYFQHSALEIGEPLAIYHYSDDRSWAFVRCRITHGWVRSPDLAMAMEKADIEGFCQRQQRLIVVGNEVDIYADSTRISFIATLSMGSSLPLERATSNGYLISLPCRRTDGTLSMEQGFVPLSEDVSEHELPFTQAHLLRQAFRSLGRPYGWGGMFEAMDCSQYVLNVLATFGVDMPRNSRAQLQIGRAVARFGPGTSQEEKLHALSRARPGMTIVGFPGHVMIYVGQHASRHYMIHNTWAYRQRRWFVDDINTIGQVVVSDVSLGEGSRRGSLLKRLTEVREIGGK